MALSRAFSNPVLCRHRCKGARATCLPDSLHPSFPCRRLRIEGIELIRIPPFCVSLLFEMRAIAGVEVVQMVCPLRFVLVFLSAFVAMVGLYQTFWMDDAMEAELKRMRKRDPDKPPEPLWSRVWSFFNGRYLYEHWQAAKAVHLPPNPQEEPQGMHTCTEQSDACAGKAKAQ